MGSFYQSHLGEFAAMATALLWTLSALAWTSAGRRIGALAVSFDRLLMALALLIGYWRIAADQWLPWDVSVQTWTILLVSGFFGFFIADLCIFKAFLIIGPRLTLLMQAITPPAVAVMSRIFLGDALGTWNWLGMAVTLGGVVWVVLEQQESPKEKHHRRDFAWGIFLAAGSAIFGGVAQVLSAQAFRQNSGSLDPFAVTLIRVIGGLVCYFPLLTMTGRWRQIGRSMLHRRAMLIAAFGSFVGPFLGVAANMKALELCTPGVVSTIINTTPVLILPFVIFVYKEKVSPRAAIGAMISVLGVALLMWNENPKPVIEKPRAETTVSQRPA
jgi:drug/metabolite transporter (DMT)-like permease